VADCSSDDVVQAATMAATATTTTTATDVQETPVVQDGDCAGATAA